MTFIANLNFNVLCLYVHIVHTAVRFLQRFICYDLKTRINTIIH